MSLKRVIKLWRGKSVKELLVEMYIDKDMTIRQIADELGVSVGIIDKWLREYGIGKNKNIF